MKKLQWLRFGLYGLAYSLLLTVIAYSDADLYYFSSLIFYLDPGRFIINAFQFILSFIENSRFLSLLRYDLYFLFSFGFLIIDFIIGAVVGLRYSALREGTYKGSLAQFLFRFTIGLLILSIVFVFFLAPPLSRYLSEKQKEQFLVEQEKSKEGWLESRPKPLLLSNATNLKENPIVRIRPNENNFNPYVKIGTYNEKTGEFFPEILGEFTIDVERKPVSFSGFAYKINMMSETCTAADISSFAIQDMAGNRIFTNGTASITNNMFYGGYSFPIGSSDYVFSGIVSKKCKPKDKIRIEIGPLISVEINATNKDGSISRIPALIERDIILLNEKLLY